MMRRQRRTTLLPNRTHCGSVTDACTDRHRHQEFLALLRQVAAYPRRQLHVVVNNYATHKHPAVRAWLDRKSTRLNSSHANISYAVFCLTKKTTPSPAVSSLS